MILLPFMTSRLNPIIAMIAGLCLRRRLGPKSGQSGFTWGQIVWGFPPTPFADTSVPSNKLRIQGARNNAPAILACVRKRDVTTPWGGLAAVK